MDSKQNLAAIGLMLTATAFIAGTTVFAKMLGAGPDGLHPLQITQGRFMFALIGFSLAAGVIRPRFTRPNLKLHALRSLMGFAGGLIVAIIRAGELSDNGASDTTEVLKHVGAGFMFIGFAAVFAAISFAIARILGEFRAGGGEVQDTVGTSTVNTLQMPVTARVFLGGMMMALLTLFIVPVLYSWRRERGNVVVAD